MDPTFEYAQKYGMEKESTYAYKGVDGSCKYTKSSIVSDLKVTGYTDVPASDSDQLQAAVAQQPVSVGIDALMVQFYFGGILSGPCGDDIDHGVLAVGYGAQGSKKYWKVKNSWGADWGESGYFRLKRVTGKGVGECGITEQASYPSVN